VVESEFSFEALEVPLPVAPAPATAVPDAADAVMDALAAARQEADAIRAAAREEGLAEGRAEALLAVAPAVQALEAAAAAVAAEQAAAADRLEVGAVDLALFLAERVVGAAVAVESGRVVETVRGALRGLVERERVTVLVNPDDLELVRDAMDGLRSSLGGIEHCEVQAERRVGRGGALVRTPDGDVDARLETKLARAREVIEAELGRSLPGAGPEGA
jgi:flagellar biosynthesis/type III secretory pathway protein FliH